MAMVRSQLPRLPPLSIHRRLTTILAKRDQVTGPLAGLVKIFTRTLRIPTHTTLTTPQSRSRLVGVHSLSRDVSTQSRSNQVMAPSRNIVTAGEAIGLRAQR